MPIRHKPDASHTAWTSRSNFKSHTQKGGPLRAVGDLPPMPNGPVNGVPPVHGKISVKTIPTVPNVRAGGEAGVGVGIGAGIAQTRDLRGLDLPPTSTKGRNATALSDSQAGTAPGWHLDEAEYNDFLATTVDMGMRMTQLYTETSTAMQQCVDTSLKMYATVSTDTFAVSADEYDTMVASGDAIPHTPQHIGAGERVVLHYPQQMYTTDGVEYVYMTTYFVSTTLQVTKMYIQVGKIDTDGTQHMFVNSPSMTP